MKSFYGRGMAQGYARGRAHIRELNRRNADIDAIKAAISSGQKCYYVVNPPVGNTYTVCQGPYLSDSDADNAAMSLGNSYMPASDEFATKHDPEGVARLKANPKL